MPNHPAESKSRRNRVHANAPGCLPNWIIAAVASLLFYSPVRAQSSRPAAATPHTATAKSSNTKFDPHDLSGVWNPAPYMQPKGEVNPLDLGGNPNPLPPFTPPGRAAYEANKKFVPHPSHSEGWVLILIFRILRSAGLP